MKGVSKWSRVAQSSIDPLATGLLSLISYKLPEHLATVEGQPYHRSNGHLLYAANQDDVTDKILGSSVFVII